MFSDAISGRLGNNWWKDNLRMSRDTFYILCNELRPYIQKESTNEVSSHSRREGGSYCVEIGNKYRVPFTLVWVDQL